MKFIRSKIIIFSLFISVVNLFALGCFFTNQALSNHNNNSMSEMACCNLGTYNFSDHAGYNLQYNLSGISYPLLNLILFFILVAFLTLKEIDCPNYYLVKDRYGGTKLFYKFILLFKTGILHPKLY